MSVKKEASGRRSVQVEVEVPGTPEEVWQAIATGPGISSWFVPTEFEERDGKPVAVKLNFGPGMESRSVVTAWDPPRMFAAQGEGWGGSPPIADRVERRSARREASASSAWCIASSPARTTGTTSWKAPNPAGPASSASCGSISRTSAANAPRSCSSMAPVAGTEAEAWETLTAALGLKGVSVGQRWTAPGGCPGAQRRGGARHPESVRRPAAARQAGAGRRRPWRRQLRRPDHGCAELLPLRRSGGRNRRPRDTAVASVDSRTLPDADGAEQERMTAWSWECTPVVAPAVWFPPLVLGEGRGGSLD